MIPRNPEHQEADMVDRWRRVASELDLDFDLLLHTDPKQTLMVIASQTCVADVVLERLQETMRKAP